MSEFMSFNSIEEMQDWMAQRTIEANENLAPEQEAITYGTPWVNFSALGQTDALCVGIVMTEEAYLADGGDVEDWEGGSIQEGHDRGYMFGRAYSKWLPEGELGDTHRASMWPIPEDLYAALEAVQWDHYGLAVEHKILLQILFDEWRAHEQEIAR